MQGTAGGLPDKRAWTVTSPNSKVQPTAYPIMKSRLMASPPDGNAQPKAQSNCKDMPVAHLNTDSSQWHHLVGERKLRPHPTRDDCKAPLVAPSDCRAEPVSPLNHGASSTHHLHLRAGAVWPSSTRDFSSKPCLTIGGYQPSCTEAQGEGLCLKKMNL